jgi:predicted nucleic acid-binding Zn ribbon protein
MKDSAMETCPKDLCCMKKWGKGKVKRLLGTGAGLIFKGSGFYITDYRSENYKQGAKSDSSGSAGSSASPTPSVSPSSTPTPKAKETKKAGSGSKKAKE